MSSRSLPPRPDLAQLKRQANELQEEFLDGSPAAVARVAAQHPRPAQTKLKLADAQLVVAREYGFASWAVLKHHVETASRVAAYAPHPRFADAVAAIDRGDLDALRRLLADRELVRARTRLEPPYGYFTGATLLHHVAWNPGRDASLPANIAAIARVLLEHGAEVDAMTLGPNAGTPLGLVLSSKQASDAGVSGALIDVLVEHGAKLSVDQAELDFALANHAPRAAEKLVELGARLDICAAAALGRLDLLRALFDGDRLREPRAGMTDRDAIGLALLFAYVSGQRDAVDFLLTKPGNWNMTGVNNGAVLHRAAFDGDLAMVKRLVAAGADLSNRDNPFTSTPLSWAQHAKQTAVFDWLADCAIDLHDAVASGVVDRVKAILREDPTRVDERRDHWDAPHCTPLYWAARTERLELVELLLDAGADANAIAGDGNTPLDVARAAGATQIMALLAKRD